MKSLLQNILEQATPDEMVAFIKSQIVDPETNQRIIKKMYNAGTGEAKDLIVAWLTSKEFSKDQIRCVLAIFDDYDKMDMLTELATNNGIIEPNDILGVTEGQLYGILTGGKVSALYQPDKEMMAELMSTQPGQKGVTVGPAEIALMVLVKDCGQNSGKNTITDEETAETIGSDLKMGRNAVEVKGREAMFCGQKRKPDIKATLKAISKYGVELKGTTDAENKDLMGLISDPTKLADFGRMCFIDYFKSSKYFDEWVTFLEIGKIKTIQNFLLSISLWALLEYQSDERFHDILIIDTGNTTYPFLHISFKGSKQTIEGLYDLCKDKLHCAQMIKDSSRKEIPKVTYKPGR